MSYRQEKGEIVISGWESGISPSPHKGIANIKNANIYTETGEVMCNFTRVKQSTPYVVAGGTLTEVTTSTATPSIPLLPGTWIEATQTAMGLTQFTNYYVMGITGGNVQLSLTYPGVLITSLSAGTCTYIPLSGGGKMVQAATE